MSRSVCVNAGKAFRTPDRASLEKEESQVAFRCEKTSIDRIDVDDERQCRRRRGERRNKPAHFDQVVRSRDIFFFAFVKKKRKERKIANLHHGGKIRSTYMWLYQKNKCCRGK